MVTHPIQQVAHTPEVQAAPTVSTPWVAAFHKHQVVVVVTDTHLDYMVTAIVDTDDCYLKVDAVDLKWKWRMVGSSACGRH